MQDYSISFDEGGFRTRGVKNGVKERNAYVSSR